MADTKISELPQLTGSVEDVDQIVINDIVSGVPTTKRVAVSALKTHVQTGLATESALTSGLAGKAATAHSHATSDVTGLDAALTGKAAAVHSHATSDVTGLDAALAGKAATTHSHATSDVTGLDAALTGKAAAVHTHATSDVTGLDASLAGKASTSHIHTTSQVTGLDAALAGLGPFPVVTITDTSATLDLTHARKYIRCTNAAAVAITMPPEASVAWAADTEIVIEQAGAGQVTVVQGAGVTIRTRLTLKTAGQYGAITLKRVGVNEWVMGGDRSLT